MFDVQTDTVRNTTVGFVGQYASATVPASTYASLLATARRSKTGITPAIVGSMLGSHSDTKQASSILTSALREFVKPTACVWPVDYSVQRYTIASGVTEESLPVVVPFMSPIIRGTPVPVPNKDMALDAVDKRITRPRDMLAKTPMSQGAENFRVTCMHEFVALLINDIGTGHGPATYDELYEKQNRPTQRIILDEGSESFVEEGAPQLRSFFKKEPSSDTSKPLRFITTGPPADKVRYSLFCLTLGTLLKKTKWYAFGRTPAEIAELVADIVSKATHVVEGDLSKFDGSLSALLREVEDLVQIKAFARDFMPELYELQKLNRNGRVSAPCGIRYDQGDGRASGNGETSTNNSISNAFLVYIALRGTKVNGAFLSPVEAYARIGAIGGDDSLVPDVDPKSLEKWANRLGLTMKAKVRTHGEPVTFLARYYGEAWQGSPNSMCDVLRQLSKFHVTVKITSVQDPVEKLKQKAYAYWLTDRNTPIIGPYVRAVVDTIGLRNCGDHMTNVFGTWASKAPVDQQYPNEYAEWMDGVIHETMPEFDLNAHAAFLERAKSLEDLLNPRTCMELQPVTADKNVAIDGEVFPAEKPATDAARSRTGDPTITHVLTKDIKRPKKGHRGGKSEQNPAKQVGRNKAGRKGKSPSRRK
jgi:hypothetical protein